MRAHPTCVVDSPAAGQLEGLEFAASWAANETAEAGRLASVADSCVSGAAKSLPKVVEASKSSQPESGQWEVVGYAFDTQKVVFGNVQYMKVTNLEQVQVVLGRGRERRVVWGYSASSWLLRTGYLRYVTGVGLVQSSKQLPLGAGQSGAQEQASGRTARGESAGPTTAGGTPAGEGATTPPGTKSRPGTLLGVEMQSSQERREGAPSTQTKPEERDLRRECLDARWEAGKNCYARCPAPHNESPGALEYRGVCEQREEEWGERSCMCRCAVEEHRARQRCMSLPEAGGRRQR